MKQALINGWIQKFNFQLSNIFDQKMKRKSRYTLRVVYHMKGNGRFEMVVARSVRTVICFKPSYVFTEFCVTFVGF